MSPNKETVSKYMEAFARGDHPGVLSLLTDDVEWLIPGAFKLEGKAAFDKEMSNPAFQGLPDIRLSRLFEEGNVVVAEGSVRARRADGAAVDLAFLDVFEFNGGRICRLVSYLMDTTKK